jgi:hypothetical protein
LCTPLSTPQKSQLHSHSGLGSKLRNETTRRLDPRSQQLPFCHGFLCAPAVAIIPVSWTGRCPCHQPRAKPPRWPRRRRLVVGPRRVINTGGGQQVHPPDQCSPAFTKSGFPSQIESLVSSYFFATSVPPTAHTAVATYDAPVRQFSGVERTRVGTSTRMPFQKRTNIPLRLRGNELTR